MRPLVFAIAILARTVHADPSDNGSKSEALALGLAIGGTVIGPSLLTIAFTQDENGNRWQAAVVPSFITGCAAIVLGPSLGDWYAGKGWSTGLGLRLGGAAALALGVVSFYSPEPSSSSFSLFQPSAGTAVFLVAGAGMIVAGTALDLRDAVVATRAHNRHTLGIAPLVGPMSGLSLAGSF